MSLAPGLASQPADGLVGLLLRRGVALILDDSGRFVPSPAGRLSADERRQVEQFQTEMDAMLNDGAWC